VEVSSGRAQGYEMMGLRKDGSRVPVEMIPRQCRVNGRVLRVVSVRDLSAQRSREQALRDSEKLNRMMFESSAVGKAQTALDATFLRVNSALARFLGSTPEALVGRGFAEFTHPDDLAQNLDLLEALKAGTVPTYSLEKRFFRVDESRATKGTGLGLAIAKEIVEAHDSTIEVSSELGKGSTFSFELPLTD
jgi:PAS domain S-box-containing protein